ncbi:MAG TPA: hypothetical protein VF389_01335 [Woeseiaceae bacterium]
MSAYQKFDESIVADIPAAYRNGAATMPETRSAQSNNTALLRASQETGYAAIGRAVQHDKSWVTRFFSDEARINRAELLHWLDACGLHLVPAGVQSADDIDLLQMMLRRTSRDLERRANERHEPDAYVTLRADEYQGLVAWAKRGTDAVMQKQTTHKEFSE